MKKTRNLAFIVELLLLFVILLLVIVVITKTFMAARSQSLYAKHLTEAVCLAENAAEVSLSASDTEEAYQLLSGMDQVREAQRDGDSVRLLMEYTDSTAADDRYQLELAWDQEEQKTGVFRTGEIRVYFIDNAGLTEPELLYTLNTGEYLSGGAA